MDDVFGQAWDTWSIDDVTVKAADTANVYFTSNPIAPEYQKKLEAMNLDELQSELERTNHDFTSSLILIQLQQNMIKNEIAKREKEKNSDNKLSPGTGSISLNGTALLIDYVNKNLAALHAFTRENDIWLNQNQLDALIMHRHLTYRLGKETQDILIEMFENTDANDPNLKNLYRDKLFEAMMNDLKSNVNEADYKKNENGWKNRIMDEIELFFDGDNIHNY